MHLHSSPASPYTRKVKIAVSVLNLSDRVQDLPTDTSNPESPLHGNNPLGKIPTLVLDDGSALYDSRVIVEYLDHVAGGGKLLPTEPKARFAALRLQALADGICDAALLIVYEGRYRSENERSKSWIDMQRAKIDRSLAVLEANVPSAGPVSIGEIALACALGYLDLRLGGAWRADHPNLVTWLAGFSAAHPVFEATRVKT